MAGFLGVGKNFLIVCLVFSVLFCLIIPSVSAATLSTQQYSDLNSIMNTHFDYFLSSNAVTSYGLPLGAYKVGDRARFGYSNPTEWGYLLQVYVAAAERGKISKATAVSKLTTSLNTLKTLQDNSAQNYNGLFYPYYKVTNSSGVDVFPYHDASTQIPSIDNALLYQSLVIIDGWALQNTSSSSDSFSALSTLSRSIYTRMNFSGFVYTQGTNKYAAHVINATTGIRGASKWDVYADEGGLMAIIEYLSGSVDLNTFKTLINSQMRSNATWNGFTVKEAAWFNSMFAWGVRSLAGIPITGTSYSKESFVPTTEAHLAYGTYVNVNYPGFSDAMTQGFVGYYLPPNLSNQVPSTAPAHSTPHAFFIPLNVLPDLNQTTLDTLMTKINAVKNDTAGYYYGSGTAYPYGFVVTTSPYANQTNYKGVNTSDGKNIFETLSHAYIALSAFNALQAQDRKYIDFQALLRSVPSFWSRLATVDNFINGSYTVSCNFDYQCQSANYQTIGTCMNPGTSESHCENIPAVNCVVPRGGLQITTSTNFCSGGLWDKTL